MDGERFDQISRLVATGSRRQLLAALIAGALAGPPGWAAPASVAARCRRVGEACDDGSRCCEGARCRGGACRCRSGWRDCDGDGRCERVRNDPTRCGKRCAVCSVPANGRATCVDGRCGFACDAGYGRCGERCCPLCPPDAPPFAQCGSGAPGTCACAQSADGPRFCESELASCALFPTCADSTDCPDGSFCATNTNCPENRCMPVCATP